MSKGDYVCGVTGWKVTRVALTSHRVALASR